MRDESNGSDVAPISSRARLKTSDPLGALLDELPLSESQRRRAIARVRESGIVESEFDEAIVGLDPHASRQPGEDFSRRDTYRIVQKMQKQADTAEAAVRRDAFDVHRYDQELNVLRTILRCALCVLLVGLGFSLWLIAIGREAVGNPILSAIVSGALSYLAGLGTPRGLLRRGGPGSERGG